jgi:DGQHR domain-containing protein
MKKGQIIIEKYKLITPCMNNDFIFNIVEDSSEQKKIANYIKKNEKDCACVGEHKSEFDMWSLLYDMKPLGISDIEVNSNIGGINTCTYANYGEFFVIAQTKDGFDNSIEDDIKNVAKCKDFVKRTICKKTGYKDTRISYVIYYSNQAIDEKSFRTASKKGVVLWTKKHFEFYYTLSKKLKHSPVDIIIPDLLNKQKISTELVKDFDIVTMKGQQGGHECYSMMLSPYLLKKIGYVNKRHLQFPAPNEEVSYQRLIDSKRIDNLHDYLKLDNSFIPSSIIVNFDTPLTKKPVSKKIRNTNCDSETVRVSLPNIYGSMYIIDGQHRVFGYYDLPTKSKEHRLHVVAFEGLTAREQAQMFVDINQNQKAISPDVLWDLYEHLYTPDDKEYVISKLVKDLSHEPLFDNNIIFIPSLSTNAIKTKKQIGINTLGRELKTNSNILKNLCNDEDFKKYEAILKAYFKLISEHHKITSDINHKNSFIVSNTGVAILVRILNHFDKYLQPLYPNIVTLSTNKIIEHLKDFTFTIVESITEIGLDNLRERKKRSASAEKNDIVKEVLLKATAIDELRFSFAKQFAFNKKEGMTCEFKAFIRYDLNKDKINESLFFNEILASIVSFIVGSIDGELYLGIDNSGNFAGLRKDMEQDEFSNCFDKVNLWITAKIKQYIKVKDYNLSDISIELYYENPEVILIKIPRQNDNQVAILIDDISSDKTQIKSWRKTSSGKQKIDRGKYKEVLSSEIKRKNYTELITEATND